MLHDIYLSDMDPNYRDNGMPLLVDDVDKDAAQFAATSPLQQAAHIARPLLLAHGGIDSPVPIDHATKLLGALRSHHAPVAWVEYNRSLASVSFRVVEPPGSARRVSVQCLAWLKQ